MHRGFVTDCGKTAEGLSQGLLRRFKRFLVVVFDPRQLSPVPGLG